MKRFYAPSQGSSAGTKARRILSALLLTALLASCTESVDEGMRYVFTGNTVASYLEKHPQYSEYVKLLRLVPVSSYSETSVMQLLSARGNYTVFAPTNEAIEAYLRDVYADDSSLMSAPQWDAFYTSHHRDSIRRAIALNSIIDSGDDDLCYETADFPETDKAEFIRSNMMENRLSVHRNIEGYPDSLYIDGDCPINARQRDIMCINGVIHEMEKVVAPRNISAATFIQRYLEKDAEGYLVMFKAIRACGLLDTLHVIRDDVYEDKYLRGQISNLYGLTSYGFNEGNIAYAPRHRLIGFTIFSETDDYWRSQGLDPHQTASELLPKLMQWILDNKQYSEEYDTFTTGNDYRSPDNLLNQWTTYHILPMRIPADHLVFHRSENGYNKIQGNLGVPVYEYYSTMGKRRLIKIYESKESDGVYLNRTPNMNHARHGDGHELSCDPDKEGCRVNRESEMAILNDIVNCCVYPINRPLALTDAVRNNLGRERMRFDAMSLFPEAMNNNMRCVTTNEERYMRVLIPNTMTSYDYFRDMQQNEETHMMYYNLQSGCPNLHTDEMKATGYYEVKLTMPPVPRRGIYELRYKVLTTWQRGMVQIYFGPDEDYQPAAGIPIDLTLPNAHPKYGYEDDSGDDDYDAEVEKRMRNKNVMKGCKSVAQDGGVNSTERQGSVYDKLRHIVWRGMMEPDRPYYLKIKNALDTDKKELYMDYFELCPKEVFDNPETPEDIW
ncbi:MAG: fasciclin domain-containing protein [Bacteroidaceae bacterium]|nr:fasciclin domain-containing protein [Bacteroidaceae bacterium]